MTKPICPECGGSNVSLVARYVRAKFELGWDGNKKEWVGVGEPVFDLECADYDFYCDDCIDAGDTEGFVGEPEPPSEVKQ